MAAWRQTRSAVLVAAAILAVVFALAAVGIAVFRIYWYRPRTSTPQEQRELQMAQERHRRLKLRLEQLKLEAKQWETEHERRIIEYQHPEGGPKSLCECDSNEENCRCY